MTQALPNNQSLVQIWLQKKYAIFLKKFLTQAGIVRRIDDLGRVVVPKEIRRTLRIREGDPLEIYTDREGQIILKKYSPVGELGEFARQYAESLAQTTGNVICITDRDQIIAVSGGSRKDMLMKPISTQLENLIEERENITATREERRFVPITQGEEEFQAQAISPIICEGDDIGSVIITTKEPKKHFGETEQKLTLSAAGFLGKQMEN